MTRHIVSLKGRRLPVVLMTVLILAPIRNSATAAAQQDSNATGQAVAAQAGSGVPRLFNEQVFWDGKRREVKAVIRHQMQCLAQYFLGKRSRYEPSTLQPSRLPVIEQDMRFACRERKLYSQ